MRVHTRMKIFFLVLAGFLLVSFFITAQADVQSNGNLCIKEEIGGDPPCTANDVRFVAMDLLSGPEGCKLGETISVTILATLESSPERYDVGIWINESGGSALSDPDGTCYRDFLDPVSADNSGCNQAGGPYYNGDNDSCGDVPAVGSDPCGSLTGPCTDGSGGTCLFTYRTISLDLVCADGDGNGFADTGWATSWDNNAAIDCTDEMGTDPGTGSKCFAYDFGDLNGIEIFCTDIDPNTECCDPATGIITPIDDEVDCTHDVCDPNTGIVTHTPDDGYCDDGVYCNGTETCDPTLDCQPGTNPCAPDLMCDEAGDRCVPVAIELSYFKAKDVGGVVKLLWGTESEVDTDGFNILRSEAAGGQYAQINDQLIPAEGGPSQGADYTYTDSSVGSGATYWYKLQEVETGGDTYLYDQTVSVTLAAGGCSAAPSAEAATVGTSKPKPVNALYPLSLPLLFIGVWLAKAVHRRRR